MADSQSRHSDRQKDWFKESQTELQAEIFVEALELWIRQNPDDLVGSVFSNGSDPGLKVMKLCHLKVQCLYVVFILDGNSEHVAQREYKGIL